jgi:hypothetical protein
MTCRYSALVSLLAGLELATFACSGALSPNSWTAWEAVNMTVLNHRWTMPRESSATMIWLAGTVSKWSGESSVQVPLIRSVCSRVRIQRVVVPAVLRWSIKANASV